MDFTLKEMSIEYYDAVLTLWQRCAGIGLSEADSRENIASFLERNPGMSYIALKGNQLVGAVLSGHDGRRGYIHHLAVAPEETGQAIGSTLVTQCIERLQIEGILKCHIFLFSNNEAGKNFWQSIGWECREELIVVSKNIG